MTFRRLLFLSWILGVGLFVSTIPARADVRLPIDAKVNGQPVHLALDTGAGDDLILFTDVAKRLGLKVTEPAADLAKPTRGMVNAGFTEATAFEWNGKVYPQTSFATVAMTTSVDIDGVIGWPMFRQDTLLLRLADFVVTAGAPLPAEVKTWNRFPFNKDEGTLRFRLTDPATGELLEVAIDTGDSEGLSVPGELWRAWRRAHSDLPATLSARFTPGYGLRVQEIVQASEFKIGPLILHDLPVQGPEKPVPRKTEGPPVLTLGLAALARVDLATDGAAGFIYLSPRLESPATPFAFNRLGAVFVPAAEDSDDLVAHVAARSPAAEAGLRDGDILQKINDLDVTGWRSNPSLLPLSPHWQQPPGSRVALTIRREDKTEVITATLVDLILPPSLRATVEASEPKKSSRER